VLKFLRWLRHGPLAALGPLWVRLGTVYRRAVHTIPGLSVRQYVGPYGPFLLSAEFAFSNFANWGGAHNRGFRACVEACRGKSCVLDIGAHIGLVTLPVSTVLGQGGTVHAFEPARANAELLRRHLKSNRIVNADVVEALVGAEDREEVRFYESAGPHGQNSIVQKRSPAAGGEWNDFSWTRKPQLSIDSYCQRRGITPQVIKIDVEGAEIGVLRGAHKTLTRSRPLVILSVHPREIALAGESLEILRDLLDELGYDIRDTAGQSVREFKLDEYVVSPREAKVSLQ
jgi:FkbM family methyltransferase